MDDYDKAVMKLKATEDALRRTTDDLDKANAEMMKTRCIVHALKSFASDVKWITEGIDSSSTPIVIAEHEGGSVIISGTELARLFSIVKAMRKISERKEIMDKVMQASCCEVGILEK